MVCFLRSAALAPALAVFIPMLVMHMSIVSYYMIAVQLDSAGGAGIVSAVCFIAALHTYVQVCSAIMSCSCGDLIT